MKIFNPLVQGSPCKMSQFKISLVSHCSDMITRIIEHTCSHSCNFFGGKTWKPVNRLSHVTLTTRLPKCSLGRTAKTRSSKHNIQVLLSNPSWSFGRAVRGMMQLLSFPLSVEVDQAHCTPSCERVTQSILPSPLIARFLRFWDWELTVEVAWKKCTLQWIGHQIMMFPDFSKLMVEIEQL